MGMISETIRLVDEMSPTLGKILKNLTGTNQEIDKTKKNLGDIPTAPLDDLEKKGKKAERQMTFLQVAVGNLASSLIQKVAGLGLSAFQMGMNFNRSIENYTTNFKVMLGSIDLAQAKVEELKQFAASTPFGMGDLAKGTQTLLSFGIETEYTTEILRTLGDVAMGDVNKFNSLTVVFGQVMSQGKLMGGDLLQLINNGFNPLQVISEQTGKSMSVLKDEMSKGQISAQMVAEAFKVATSEGGLFYQGMAEGAATFDGVLSTMKDNISSLLGTVLKPITDIVKGVMQVIINIVSFVQPIVDTIVTWVSAKIQTFVQFLQTHAGAIQVILLVLAAVGVAVAIKLTIAWTMMAVAWVAAHLPIILVVGAVIGIIILLVNIMTACGIDINSILGAISGAFHWAFAWVNNIIVGFLDGVLLPFYNAFVTKFRELARLLQNVFKNPITAIIKMFTNMAINVLNIVGKIAKGIDKIFKTNLSSGVENIQNSIRAGSEKLISKLDPNNTWDDSPVEQSNVSAASLGLKKMDTKQAWSKGYDKGHNLMGNLGKGLKGLGAPKGGGGLPQGAGSKDFGSFVGSLEGTGGEVPKLGKGTGGGTGKKLDGIGKGIKGVNDKLDGQGTLKSVGETKIKDENLKYLKDLSALKYQKEYQNIQPNKNITVNLSTGAINTNGDANSITNQIVNKLVTALEGNIA